MPDTYGWIFLLAQVLQYKIDSKRPCNWFLLDSDFHKRDSSLCTDWRRPAAARTTLSEGKQWFQNALFCKETILLKQRMLPKAGVATKYLLRCRDHNVHGLFELLKCNTAQQSLLQSFKTLN